MAKSKRRSSKPWVIAVVEESTGFYKSDMFFDNKEEAEAEFYGENRNYHERNWHQIMTSDTYYDFIARHTGDKRKNY